MGAVLQRSFSATPTHTEKEKESRIPPGSESAQSKDATVPASSQPGVGPRRVLAGGARRPHLTRALHSREATRTQKSRRPPVFRDEVRCDTSAFPWGLDTSHGCPLVHPCPGHTQTSPFSLFAHKGLAELFVPWTCQFIGLDQTWVEVLPSPRLPNSGRAQPGPASTPS